MNIGMLVFSDITAVDYVAPTDLLARIPSAPLDLVLKRTSPIKTELDWESCATALFATWGHVDMIVVPGGPRIGPLLKDDEVLRFPTAQVASAKWVVGIGTGPLVLGAGGLLEGYEATCHWASRQLLSLVGAKPGVERVVAERYHITGAGMTSGIDCALHAIDQQSAGGEVDSAVCGVRPAAALQYLGRRTRHLLVSCGICAQRSNLWSSGAAAC